MKRREFITLLGGAAAAWPLGARAQQPGERMRRIGVLMPGAADDPEYQARITAFLQGLAQLGWLDGRNVRIDTRWGIADADRIRKYAAELLAFQGQATDVMLHAQEILNLKKRLNEIYVKHTGQPLKKIEDALERDYFLTGEMAMEWGIVDKVINKRPEDPAALKAV